MFDLTGSSGRGHRILHVLAVSILAAGGIVAVSDGAFGWFFVLAIVGGTVSGLLMIALQRRAHLAPDIAAPDSFARDGLGTDVINVSRIRVAGIGGLGMIAVAVAMAFTIPRIGVSLALGLVGGFFASLALIAYRRRHAGRWS